MTHADIIEAVAAEWDAVTAAGMDDPRPDTPLTDSLATLYEAAMGDEADTADSAWASVDRFYAAHAAVTAILEGAAS